MKKFRFKPTMPADFAKFAKTKEKQTVANNDLMLRNANASADAAIGAERLASVSNGHVNTSGCNQTQICKISSFSNMEFEELKKQSLHPAQGGEGALIVTEPSPAVLKIEPMTTCLHGDRCPHLKAPGRQRPVCKKNGHAIFDMQACPMGLWARQLQ